MTSCKIRILDECNIVVVGLADHHLAALSSKYAVTKQGAFFSPKFKLGQWDGKIRFFTQSGKTYLYLIEELLPLISQMGYSISIDDLRRPLSSDSPELIDCNWLARYAHPLTKEPIVLRDLQVDGVNSLIQHGHGLCIAATGAGKTILCAALVHAYGNLGLKSITIVPSETLIKQTKAQYINVGLDTGEYSGTEKTLKHQHIVSTWQALKNNPMLMSDFQMVIVDECHSLKGPVLQDLICKYGANIPYRFGVTGTLPKDDCDKMAVHISVGPVRYTIKADVLIDQGILANLQININQLEEDFHTDYAQYTQEQATAGRPIIRYSEFKDQLFPDFSAEKNYLYRNKDRISAIVDIINQKMDLKQGNVLCLVNDIALARKLSSLIPGSYCVNGQDIKKASDRQAVYKQFADRDDVCVIATVHIAGTGLDIPRIFNLITVDLGKSFIRIIQAVGRGLRKASDKDSVVFTDICSDLKYSRKHLTDRMKFYAEANYPHKKQKIKYKESQSVLS